MNLYQSCPNNSIKCLACCNYCVIKDGQTGVCGVRRNDGGKLDLLVYGRPCAIHVDPIEKKPLYHFLPGSQILSLGTFGCNFACEFCQNWDISQLKVKDSQLKLEYFSPEKIVQLAKESNCPAIAYTYNEPTIWTEYAMDIAKLANQAGLKNIYVSNGYLSPECAEFVAPYLDAINIDLKSFSEDFYNRICHAKLQPVLNTIKKIHELNIWEEITTLLIPEKNDSEEELKQIAFFIASISPNIPWHISAFHGDYKMADHQDTSLESLLKAWEIGKSAGLNYVYLGNVNIKKQANTYCAACGKIILERDYLSLTKTNLVGDRCKYCGNKIPGVFI